jgi:uncharacterized membrane protein YraQ (UPF0718 family)
VGPGAVTPFCSCSSIPLLIGFVETGIRPGVSLSFLTASPMVNEVAVGVLASVIGWKFTALDVAASAWRSSAAWCWSVILKKGVKVPLLALLASHLATAFVVVGLLFSLKCVL